VQRSLVGPALIAALLVVSSLGSTPAPEAIQTDRADACTAPSVEKEQALRNAVKVEDRGINERGNRVVRYYQPISFADNGCIQYDLAVAHQDANAFARSPEWYNSANGRYYFYTAGLWMNHEVNLNGPDQYGYGMQAECWRRLGTTEVRNYCTFNTYVGLQRSTSGGEGTFSATWGYNKVYQANNPKYVCADEGAMHSVTDSTTAIRTWAWIDVGFWSDTGSFLHAASARKTVSYADFAGEHLFYSMIGTNKFIDAGASPTPNTSKLC
jgi:hypothetical protein